MSHDITSEDHAVFSNKSAWHGLGTTVESAPTPGQALVLAKLDWEVQSSFAMFADFEGTGDTGPSLHRTPIDNRKALRRSDTGRILGVMGKDYTPVQNTELAEFCYELADLQADVTVESAGSLRQGRRVWFLLRSSSLFVGGNENDEVKPYVFIYNSNDGSSALELMPTSIRVVCANTAKAARQHSEKNSFRHTPSILDRVKQHIPTLRACFESIEQQVAHAGVLSEMEVDESCLDSLYYRVYDECIAKIPSAGDPEDGDAKKSGAKRDKAFEIIKHWKFLQREECDAHGFSLNMWTASQAVTAWLDHDMPITLRKNSKHDSQNEARTHSKLFGRAASKKQAVMEHFTQEAAMNL